MVKQWTENPYTVVRFYPFPPNASIAQKAERIHGKDEVVGSTPTRSSTQKIFINRGNKMDSSNGNPKHFTIEDIDLAAFLTAIDNCNGPVILFTDEGDRFNLKSKLSQLAGIFNLIQGGKFVKAKVYCPNEEDETMLFRLGLFGPEEE